MNLAEATYVFENNYGDSAAVREAGEIVNAELDRLSAELERAKTAMAEAYEPGCDCATCEYFRNCTDICDTTAGDRRDDSWWCEPCKEIHHDGQTCAAEKGQRAHDGQDTDLQRQETSIAD